MGRSAAACERLCFPPAAMPPADSGAPAPDNDTKGHGPLGQGQLVAPCCLGGVAVDGALVAGDSGGDRLLAGTGGVAGAPRC